MQNLARPIGLALLGGLALGTVGTLNHRGVIGIGAHNLPWGIVVGLIGCACFLTGVRLYSGSRLITLAGAVGLLVPILLFSFEGPGGSVVVVADGLGRTWDFVPALIAIAVLAWPSRRGAAGDAVPGPVEGAPTP